LSIGLEFLKKNLKNSY